MGKRQSVLSLGLLTGVWGRDTDAVNQVGGVSRRSWFSMRSSVYILHLGLIFFIHSVVHLFIHQKALFEHLLHVG